MSLINFAITLFFLYFTNTEQFSMGEVVNISLSQFSNHVSTHLFNNQESHIPYKKNATVNYRNNVFLSTSSSGGHTNYAPRALIYDLREGLGSLNKYEYHEPPSNFDHIPSGQRVNLERIVPKNQYQINLDKGVNPSAQDDILTTGNTKYWTDYNKLIYNSKSLNTLTNFKHQQDGYGIHQNFRNLKFNTFNVGQQEFSDNRDNIDTSLDTFRYFLEKCDLLQGLSLVTEMDSAWAGYSNSLLTELIDEYFSTGISNSKHSIWMYGLYGTYNSGKPNLAQVVSRIKSTIELTKNSTLFLPINTRPSSLELFTNEYDDTSPWHSSSVSSMFINSIWGINNQVDGSHSMSEIEDSLLRGNYQRKIVNEVKLNKIKPKAKEVSSIYNLSSDVDISAYYSNPESLLKEKKQTMTKDDYVDLSFPTSIPNDKAFKPSKSTQYFVKDYIIPKDGSEDLEESLNKRDQGTPKNVYRNRDITDVMKGETFPKRILSDQENFNFYTEFNVNTDFRAELSSFKTLLSNIKPSHVQLMEIIEDRAELVEDISKLMEEYTIGTQFSDESDDDDY
ncbi:tubulin domain-containing protein [Scheffersomyces xylosifermentans]|uniref:tubulin domain-containing protein n=1 Tax=Scheffersomyces xylosifermentans TaxID=1304137 RepID=UPI00315C9E99